MTRTRIFMMGAVLVTASAIWMVMGFIRSADVGAAAMAKVSCSCVFVEGRSLEACRADDPPGFEGVTVSINDDAHLATGSVLGLIHRAARYNTNTGCTLEP